MANTEDGSRRLTAEELENRVLTEPELDSLRVDLAVDCEDSPRELLARAAEEEGVEIPAADGWDQEPVHEESQPGAWFLVPPEEHGIPVGDAWSLAYGLQARAGVLDAEPLFDLVLDAADQPSLEPPPPGAPEGVELAPGMAAAATALEAGDDCLPRPVNDRDPDWSPKLVRAPQAWQIPPAPGGAARGRGIRIGHPDSGYLRHRELFDPDHEPSDRVLAHLGFDFVGDDPDAETDDGGHGLGTASVLMSSDAAHGGSRFVHGVAPEAEIIPFRVARKWLLTPALIRGGMRLLAKAIYRAADPPASCHVISISLGWLASKTVHEAVRYAVQRDVIVVAAAGNWVPLVVWPGAYPEAICVAGCTDRRGTWIGSSFGLQVDVTAPARNVWKATDDSHTAVGTSDGTSFATATTAGLAALWLAHWGRDHLLQRYQGSGFTLATVFRRLLRATCDPPPHPLFGAGIVNACRLLKAPLPEVDELLSAGIFLHESVAAGTLPPVAASGLESVATALGRPERDVRRSLAELTGIPEERLRQELRGVGDETAFQILTSPQLRRALARQAAPPAPEGAPPAHLPESAPLEAAPPSLSSLGPLRLSPRLRDRLPG